MAAIPAAQDIREMSENSLPAMISLISPETVLGHVHHELCHFLTSSNSLNKLVLLPRDHAKSRTAAFYCIQLIAKRPDIRILYVSATAKLAELQLGFIKQKLESKTFRRYWPDHIHPVESQRKKWTNNEIMLDHPSRDEEGIRDPTIFAAGLTTVITGMHFDVLVLDDVVVDENAYTEDGRTKVKQKLSQLVSVAATDAHQVVVGTRYHPRDVYGDFQTMSYEYTNDDGEVEDRLVYDTFMRVVETDGEFLWPVQERASDGKKFGFNANILNKKKAQYLDRTQFYAQYYNNPNNPEGAGINSSKFQYYNRDLIQSKDGRWFYGREPLNIAASMDLAYTVKKSSDWTSIVVGGMDPQNNYYVLDIDRFRSKLISEYYDHLFVMYAKWGFRKVRIEITAAQSVVVEDLKQNYIKKNGIVLSIDEFLPTRGLGRKGERIDAILQPRYANLQMWHYRGGLCQTLEDELVLENPPHDDLKDTWSNCVEMLKPPARKAPLVIPYKQTQLGFNRFGGFR